MPIEIRETNGYVAEVRFVCDKCHKLLGTRFMLKTEAETQEKNQIICQQCKEVNEPKRKPEIP